MVCKGVSFLARGHFIMGSIINISFQGVQSTGAQFQTSNHRFNTNSNVCTSSLIYVESQNLTMFDIYIYIHLYQLMVNCWFGLVVWIQVSAKPSSKSRHPFESKNTMWTPLPQQSCFNDQLVTVICHWHASWGAPG